MLGKKKGSAWEISPKVAPGASRACAPNKEVNPRSSTSIIPNKRPTTCFSMGDLAQESS